MLLVLAACFEAVVKCYEKAVKQSGRQLKEVSPVADQSQFLRQRLGKEKLSAKDWIEAMPEDTARYFFLNCVVEFGFPIEVVAAAQVKGRVEQAS